MKERQIKKKQDEEFKKKSQGKRKKREKKEDEKGNGMNWKKQTKVRFRKKECNNCQ